ncbi:hypothetical protein [Clostridium tetani]|uniref:hypothetical protein n=1 Tax=Clostridium tetani TaxID=1513 RepID=UPI0018F87CD4|nr:hypothetical protein [Clostridium tetani]
MPKSLSPKLFVNNIYETLSKTKMFIVLIILCFNCISRLRNIIQCSLHLDINLSIYDLIMYIFNNFPTVLFTLNFLFLFLIPDILLEKSSYLLSIIRYKNRTQWYKNKLLSILFISICYVTLIIIICCIIGIGNLNFDNVWNDGSIILNDKLNNGFMNNFTPINLVIITSLFLILNFTSIGIFFYIGVLIFKKDFYGFLFSLFPIVSTALIHKLHYINLYGISLYNNINFLNHNVTQINTYFILLKCTLYWILIISICNGIGFYLVKNMDFNFGGSNE